MKIITKEIANRMPVRYAQDGKGLDAIVHLKLFNAFGAGTWLITEGWKVVEGANGEIEDKPLSYELSADEKLLDTELFGYCHIHEWEWGPVSLNELQSARKFGAPAIEREKWESTGKKTVKELIQ